MCYICKTGDREVRLQGNIEESVRNAGKPVQKVEGYPSVLPLALAIGLT